MVHCRGIWLNRVHGMGRQGGSGAPPSDVRDVNNLKPERVRYPFLRLMVCVVIGIIMAVGMARILPAYVGTVATITAIVGRVIYRKRL